MTNPIRTDMDDSTNTWMTYEMKTSIQTFGFWFEDSKDREDWAAIVALQPLALDDDWALIDETDFDVIVCCTNEKKDAAVRH